jgi:hypothetical protein
LTSCKKHGGGLIKGTVYVSGTNQALSNCLVKLKQSHHGNSAFDIDTARTDDNGNYKFNYWKKFGYEYVILAYTHSPTTISAEETIYDSQNKNATIDLYLK